RKMSVKPAEEIELRFIVDSYSIELFVNNGEKVMSTEIQTPIDAEQIRFCSDGTALLSLVKHDIKIF
ncbi:MAG: GH32 C-terminal domain-containing protein, partial [Bifidobacteriaceae bacterium]|nr:GH32 C-terminal domain-containing protein [Bifidobacteriaceae bacterium]